ncbi:hypothetical protein F5X98DRAFT_42481 [Xylaria grammica]|nr:hypothetical protein F5X98DRAFT_42481 [Xylaria grammica]
MTLSQQAQAEDVLDYQNQVATELGLYKPRRLQRYANVNVLLLTWADADLHFATEANQLAKMFRESFGYRTLPYQIPSEDPQRQLNLHVAQFIASYGRDDNLIIVYYGGHGSQGGELSFEWGALISGGPTIDWSSIQPQFLGAGCDVALLLDCCFAGQAVRARVSHSVELLAATDKDQFTPKGTLQWPSFTKALIGAMKAMIKTPDPITLLSLQRRMLDSQTGLRKQPFYVSMNAGEETTAIKLLPLTTDVLSNDARGAAQTDLSENNVLLNLRLRLQQPLDTGTTASLIKWMTKDSPSLINDIQLVNEIITEAHAARNLAEQLVQSTTQNQEVEHRLPLEVAKETLKRLNALTSSIETPATGQVGDIQAIQIINEVREKSDQLLSFMTDCISTIDSATLKELRSMNLFNVKDLKDRVSMRLELAAEGDRDEGPARVSFIEPAKKDQRLRIGMKDQVKVLVDYAYCRSRDPKAVASMLTRFARNATLHKESKIPAFCTLQGMGFVHEELYGPRFGMIFKYPSTEDSDSHILLSKAILEVKVVALERRYELALALCEAIFHLHSIGWYHKAIKNDNILIQTKASGNTESGCSRRTYHFERPYIIGFDSSRPDDAETYGTVDFEHSNNIYRHPARWGTSRPFQRHHDIYALGILMLEIGCWKLLKPNEFKQTNPEEVRDALLGPVCEKLAHASGSKYASVVRVCLDRREWDKLNVWEIQNVVRQEIWRPLSDLCTSHT